MMRFVPHTERHGSFRPDLAQRIASFDAGVTDLTVRHEQHKRDINAAADRLDALLDSLPTPDAVHQQPPYASAGRGPSGGARHPFREATRTRRLLGEDGSSFPSSPALPLAGFALGIAAGLTFYAGCELLAERWNPFLSPAASDASHASAQPVTALDADGVTGRTR